MLEATIGELQQGLEEGRYTSEDLVNYYLERIAVYDESLYNSLVTINEEAVSLSRELDAERAAGTLRGPLHGIPIVVKDNIDVAGLPTTNGYSVNWNNIAGTDAEAVRLLKEAGAIVLAKGNMSTGAQIARYTISDAAGETLNAYNTDYSAGGSSGGVSVAVAANFAAAGIGTDTNSSIRYPAALASLVGLRPTFGLISLDGVEVLNWDRDTVGTLTRTVEDTACLLSAMTGNDYTVYLGASGLAGRKIGVVLELTEQGRAPRQTSPMRTRRCSPSFGRRWMRWKAAERRLSPFPCPIFFSFRRLRRKTIPAAQGKGPAQGGGGRII